MIHGELLVDWIMLAGCPCVVVALVVVGGYGEGVVVDVVDVVVVLCDVLVMRMAL